MADKESYSQLSTELDELLEKLQNSSLDIDKATELYERGMQIIQKLETHLTTAQNKVEKIKKSFSK